MNKTSLNERLATVKDLRWKASDSEIDELLEKVSGYDVSDFLWQYNNEGGEWVDAQFYSTFPDEYTHYPLRLRDLTRIIEGQHDTEARFGRGLLCLSLLCLEEGEGGDGLW